MGGSLTIFLVAGLAFLAIAGLGLALSSGKGDAARKRAKEIAAGGQSAGPARRGVDDNTKRRQKTQEMLAELRRRDKDRKRASSAQDIKTRLTQAGIDMPVSVFWIISIITGVVFAGGVYLSGVEGLVINGMELKSQPVLVGAALFAGMLGVPRFILSSITKSRHQRMVNQFADALDIIVRGVKSGLPLNECIKIIAKESPEPLRSEFHTFADGLQMGTGLDRALAALYKRMPLQEMNFFSIVLLIQAKAGGNLSEALHNLSTVIRARKMMKEKVKAMSSEAKASAMIIGALPFAVGTMVFITSPDYIMELFLTETGHFILVMAAGLMMTGIMVMRRMINFDV
jgi:tight adherence protein B